MTIRLHNFDIVENILGPYKRAIIWTQGCPFRCKNCMTPDSLDINGGKEIEIEELVKTINSINDIEGITISGGEPFLQDEKLVKLIKLLKKDLGVIVYTGYLYEEIKERELINYIDLLIDGKYEEDKNNGIAFRGSFNQRLFFLSNRYKKFEKEYNSFKRKVEIRVTERIEVIGIPSKKVLEKIKCL
jgi:anaerobic ribonucleoside-triphosphate reductase activating protein